jgi:hypothetical protein
MEDIGKIGSEEKLYLSFYPLDGFITSGRMKSSGSIAFQKTPDQSDQGMRRSKRIKLF